MAVYHCNECQNFVDNDWHPCEEDPRNPSELLCPECAIELEWKTELQNEEIAQRERQKGSRL